MNNYLKINGNLNPNHFLNNLANKISSEFGDKIQIDVKNKEKAKFNVIFENQEEEQGEQNEDEQKIEEELDKLWWRKRRRTIGERGKTRRTRGTGTTAPSDNSNKDTTNSIIPIKIVNTNKNNKPAITKSHGEETEEVSQEENVEKIDEVKEEDNKATKTVKEESAKEEEEIDQKSLIIIGLVIIGLIACLSFILLKNSKGNEELYL